MSEGNSIRLQFEWLSMKSMVGCNNAVLWFECVLLVSPVNNELSQDSG